MHNSLKTYLWEESDLPAVNFNLELVSIVNFSGESMTFSKNDVGEIANLCRRKKVYFDLHLKPHKKYQFQMVCILNIKQYLFWKKTE